jgi:hypothetical protein
VDGGRQQSIAAILAVCYARRADRGSIIPGRADETARPVRAGEGSVRAERKEDGEEGRREKKERGWCGVARDLLILTDWLVAPFHATLGDPCSMLTQK